MFDWNWDADEAVHFVIVIAAISAIIVYLVRAFRRQGEKPWPALSVGIYNILLLLLFLFGMMTERESEGFGFLPLIGLTLPWSWLLDWSLGRIMDLNFHVAGLPNTFFYTFAIHNVLAGSVNSCILYLFLKRWQKKAAEDEAWEQARRNRS
jgi:hypothetical protein